MFNKEMTICGVVQDKTVYRPAYITQDGRRIAQRLTIKARLDVNSIKVPKIIKKLLIAEFAHQHCENNDFHLEMVDTNIVVYMNAWGNIADELASMSFTGKTAIFKVALNMYQKDGFIRLMLTILAAALEKELATKRLKEEIGTYRNDTLWYMDRALNRLRYGKPTKLQYMVRDEILYRQLTGRMPYEWLDKTVLKKARKSK